MASGITLAAIWICFMSLFLKQNKLDFISSDSHFGRRVFESLVYILVTRELWEASSCGFAKIVDPARFWWFCAVLVISAQKQWFQWASIKGACRIHCRFHCQWWFQWAPAMDAHRNHCFELESPKLKCT